MTMVVSPETIWLHHDGQVQEIVLPTVSSHHSIDFNALIEKLEPYQTTLSGRIVDVILANSLVRYATLPWQPHLYKQQDWLAVAKRYLRDVFGHNAELWRVSISLQGYGNPIIVAAVDAMVCDGLENLAAQYHWKLNNLEPAFACVVNYYQRSFNRQSWLLMVEQHRFVLAQSYDGIWQHFTVAIPQLEQGPAQCILLVKQAQQLRRDDEKVTLYLYGHQNLMSTDFGDEIDVHILPNMAQLSSPAQLDYGYLS